MQTTSHFGAKLEAALSDSSRLMNTSALASKCSRRWQPRASLGVPEEEVRSSNVYVSDALQQPSCLLSDCRCHQRLPPCERSATNLWSWYTRIQSRRAMTSFSAWESRSNGSAWLRVGPSAAGSPWKRPGPPDGSRTAKRIQKHEKTCRGGPSRQNA